MRTFGDVHFHDGDWLIKAEPHVMLRLKAVFPRINKFTFDTVSIQHSPEVARDLEWFILRYPLVVHPDSVTFLAEQSQLHQRTLFELEQLNLATYKPMVTGLAKPLREYQSRAIEIHWRRKCLLNADVLGLGKSITALGSLTKPGTLPAMVICQTHLQRQWKAYINEFLPEARVHILKQTKTYPLPPTDIFICTYHKLHGWCETLGPSIKSLIFDEVQELRHDGSGKYRAAEALRKKAEYVTGLSATPIYNYGGEIFNVMDIISPGQLGTKEEFKREWCRKSYHHDVLDNPDAFGHYLRENFLMVRRTRKEVGRELPPLETIVESIEYNEQVLEDVDNVALELAKRIMSENTTFHDKGEAAREFDIRLRQATGIAKASHVAAFVQMLVDDGRKVLLTGWHRAVYDIWQEQFKAANIKCVLYTGSESELQKDISRQEFLNGVPVMIISHKSGAGLDGLQTVCDTIVHGEMAFSPSIHGQLTGRLFRDGQPNPVQEFYLVADGGSDPILSEICGLKKDQHRGLLSPGTGGLEELQTDLSARVKLMAEAYLKKHKQ